MDWIDGTLDRPTFVPRASAGADTVFWGRDALLDDVRARLRRGDGFGIATLNLDHVVKLRSDPAFRSAYAAQSHVTADGNPIVWLERMAGRRAELVPGSELVVPLARIAADLGIAVAFVGSTDASLEGAARALAREVPRLRVVARIAPPMGFDPTSDEAAAIVERLRESGARLCFVALGAPKQERFAAFAGAALPHTGFACIGAGLDFLSGSQMRAPRVVRALALEWLWRLAGDPGRLVRRYAACAAVLPQLSASALRSRRASSQPAKGGT